MSSINFSDINQKQFPDSGFNFACDDLCIYARGLHLLCVAPCGPYRPSWWAHFSSALGKLHPAPTLSTLRPWTDAVLPYTKYWKILVFLRMFTNRFSSSTSLYSHETNERWHRTHVASDLTREHSFSDEPASNQFGLKKKKKKSIRAVVRFFRFFTKR